MVLCSLSRYVETRDGRTAEIDVHAFIGGLDALRDSALFAKVAISELRELTWPSGDSVGPEQVEQMLSEGAPYAVLLPKVE